MKKNWCKHLLFLMVAVLSITSFVSCKGDDDDAKSVESRLVGKWVTEIYEDGEYATLTMVLNKDGKGQMIYEYPDDYDIETETIKWSVIGESILSIAFADGDYEDPLKATFTLSEDGQTLKWNMYTFKKK